MNPDLAVASVDLADHAELMRLGLTDPVLFERATHLDNEWRQLAGEISGMPEEQAYAEMATSMGALRDLQVETLGHLEVGDFVGWLYPMLVAHMIREGDYWEAKLFGDAPSAVEFVCLKIGLLSEHAAITAQYLDPSEVDLRAEGQRIADHVSYYAQPICGADLCPELLADAADVANTVDDYLAAVSEPGVRSVLPPQLVEHMRREGHTFLATLADLAEANEA